MIPFRLYCVMCLIIVLMHNPYPETSSAECSDEEFLKADRAYQLALKEQSHTEQVNLLESAFDKCPNHGSFAEGYYLLGKLYYNNRKWEKAFEWLFKANSFSAPLIERSVDDLAQTHRLLGKLYRQKNNAEKAIVHFNIYRMLTKSRDKSLEADFINNADAILTLVYSSGTVKQALTVNKSIPSNYRAKINRVELFFNFGAAALDEAAAERLDVFGAALSDKSFKDCSIIVEGHTDEVGSSLFNCELGMKRAKAVADYLKDRRGLTDVNFLSVSYGESNPMVTRKGRPQAQWPIIDKLNRRVSVWNAGVTKGTTKDIDIVYFGGTSPCSSDSP